LNKHVQLAVIAGSIVFIDQITKAIILQSLPLYRSIPVIPQFFDITHIQNSGGAFGLLAGQQSTVRNLVFISISLLAMGFVLYLYITTPSTHTVLAVGFALILGGAVGNLIDRIRFGSVVDFLDFYIGNLHWPAFNVADSAITVGIGIFLFYIVFRKLPE
jgi:signal peptidase II